MNYRSRLLFLLSSLAISGFIASSILSTSAQTVKPAHSNKTPFASKNPKQNHNANNQSANNNNDDSNDDDDDSNDDDNKNPTQSLFEAINVGNLYAAQDALNRGADLHATNILGQTPLEMSIDLNRDRITFLLLSMRGYNNSPQSLGSDSEIATISMKNDKGYLSVKGKNEHKTTSNKNKTSLYSRYNHEITKPEIGFLGFHKS